MERKEKNASLIRAFLVALVVFLGFQIFFSHREERIVKKEAGKKVSLSTVSSVPGDLVPSKKLGKIVRVETPLYEAEISTVNGKLLKLYVKKYKVQLVSNASKLTGIYPLMTVSDNATLNKELSEVFLIPSSSEIKVKDKPQTLVLTGEIGGKKFVKKFTFYPDSYRIDVEASLGDVPLQTLIGADIKINEAHTSRMGHIGPVVETERKVFRLKPKDISGYLSFGRVLWAGEEDKYFLMAVKSSSFSVTVEKIPPDHTVVRAFTSKFTFYGGPKEIKQLEPLGMDSAINFGVLGFLAKPLFKFFLLLHRFIPNWGWAIVVFTLIVKVLLHPLTHKSYVSMKKMQEIAPRLEEIKNRYKNNPQKLQEETMKLYREAGVNPAGGCLPILLQIPIFFALYEIFLNAVELKGAPFLWVKDLSTPDPTYILPILMGISMVAQQFLTPTANPQQRNMFIGVSVVFTFLFAKFHAGLVLYWFVNNLITAVQNAVIKKFVERTA
jgi:YidC/Oxa1 family membrane protein insertase